MKLTKQQLIDKLKTFGAIESIKTNEGINVVNEVVFIIRNTEIISDSEIEPKPEPVDTELEEAKKRFPVNSWIEDGFCLRQVVGHVRKKEGICIKYYTEVSHSGGEPYSEYKELSDCTPARLPTRKINWRCMKTDAPDSVRDVLARVDGLYYKAWFHEPMCWSVEAFYIDISKYDSALWCELKEIEGE